MTGLAVQPTAIERVDALSSSQAPAAPVGGRVDAVNVSRRVGARQILQELSLSIEPGELVAIACGSGAGKTTLLEILAGLQPPSGGEVSHNGVVRGARRCRPNFTAVQRLWLYQACDMLSAADEVA